MTEKNQRRVVQISWDLLNPSVSELLKMAQNRMLAMAKDRGMLVEGAELKWSQKVDGWEVLLVLEVIPARQ